MFDTHLHTTFSTDATMSSEEAISAAQKAGLGIIITEHLDLEYPENPEAFLFDFAAYFRELGHRRNEKLLLGVELGLRTECNEKNRQLVKGWPFDEIVGSIHVVDGLDIYGPPFTKDRNKSVAYGRYFVNMLECVKNFDNFDTLGHVDYICRYAGYQDPEIHLADFYEEWSEVCRVLLAKGKVLELNTRRLGQESAVSALKPLYQRYKELGGRYLTIGSDAHRADNIGSMFGVAWELAESLGLLPVYFKERKMVLDKR
jgi:histidinol-phosphatase (PHP family)